jgi:hypothetical protein
MRRALGFLLAAMPALACVAADLPEGRWDGLIRIPGRTLAVTIDLSPGPAGGAWIGSITVAGLALQGAPLANIVTTPGEVAFDVAQALDTPAQGPARFKARVEGEGQLRGELSQGGNVAPFAAVRVGASQVALPPRSTPVARALEGAWVGSFELGGYPREVTLTLANRTGSEAGATATLVVVGKRTTELAVDLVAEEGSFLRVESRASQVVFEGLVVDGAREIRGTFAFGPLELPLVLRRPARSAS